MATYTENYDLLLTEATDSFDILDYNENFETIDTLMAENEAVVNEVNDKLGTPEDGETVFSLLKNSGSSVIKSIQVATVTHPTNEFKTSTVSIETVVPEKCIVLVDRLQDDSGSMVKVEYTLSASTLTVETGVKSSGTITLQFQIIEFN